MDRHQVEIWLSVDSHGNVGVSADGADDAREALACEMNGDVRTVRLVVSLSLPQTVNAEIDVPDGAGRVDAIAS